MLRWGFKWFHDVIDDRNHFPFFKSLLWLIFYFGAPPKETLLASSYRFTTLSSNFLMILMVKPLSRKDIEPWVFLSKISTTCNSRSCSSHFIQRFLHIIIYSTRLSLGHYFSTTNLLIFTLWWTTMKHFINKRSTLINVYIGPLDKLAY